MIDSISLLTFLLSCFAGAIGFFMLPSKIWRQLGWRLLRGGTLGAVLSLASVTAFGEDRDAKRAGFDSAQDRQKAMGHNISDPEIWKTKKVEIQDRARANALVDGARKAEREARELAERRARENAEKARAAGFSDVAEMEAAASAGHATKDAWEWARAHEMLVAPDMQRRFVDIVTSSGAAYANANSPGRNEARARRRAEICKLFDLKADGWVGTLKSLTPLADGSAALSIEIAPKIEVKTSGTSAEDGDFLTLLPQASLLLKRAREVSPGERVRFSARFFASNEDCIKERSWTERGAMTAPEFTARFTSLLSFQPTRSAMDRRLLEDTPVFEKDLADQDAAAIALRRAAIEQADRDRIVAAERAERLRVAAAEKAEKDRVATEARIMELAEKARQEEEACRQDLRCSADKHSLDAEVACRPLVEQRAKFQAEWTYYRVVDSMFTGYRWRNAAKTEITYVGDKVKFQNGFGAWQFSTYLCVFNTLTGTVVDVTLTEGRYAR